MQRHLCRLVGTTIVLGVSLTAFLWAVGRASQNAPLYVTVPALVGLIFAIALLDR